MKWNSIWIYSTLIYTKHQIKVFSQFNTLLPQYHKYIPFKSYTYINNKSFSFLLSSGILFSKSFILKQRELIKKFLFTSTDIFVEDWSWKTWWRKNDSENQMEELKSKTILNRYRDHHRKESNGRYMKMKSEVFFLTWI